MSILRRAFLTFFGLVDVACAAEVRTVIPRQTRQLVVVAAESWTSPRAVMQRFTRSKSGAAWVRAGGVESVLIGERGLGWGLGLHEIPAGAAFRKQEGDRRAPAGVFRVSGAFGRLDSAEAAGLKMPFRPVTATLEAVDDPASRYYNRIVDRAAVSRPDWRSAEKLMEIRHYRLALTVDHNPGAVRGAGSCIFLHEWIGQRRGTAGCTILRRAALHELARWLEPARHPVLVQLPRGELPADLQP